MDAPSDDTPRISPSEGMLIVAVSDDVSIIETSVGTSACDTSIDDRSSSSDILLSETSVTDTSLAIAGTIEVVASFMWEGDPCFLLTSLAVGAVSAMSASDLPGAVVASMTFFFFDFLIFFVGIAAALSTFPSLSIAGSMPMSSPSRHTALPLRRSASSAIYVS